MFLLFATGLLFDIGITVFVDINVRRNLIHLPKWSFKDVILKYVNIDVIFLSKWPAYDTDTCMSCLHFDFILSLLSSIITDDSQLFKPRKHWQKQIHREVILPLCYGFFRVCLHETGASRGGKTQLWGGGVFPHGRMLTRECASQSEISEGWWSALCGHAAACGLRRWSEIKTASEDLVRKTSQFDCVINPNHMMAVENILATGFVLI